MNSLLSILATVMSLAAILLAASGGQDFARVDAGGHPVRMSIAGHGSPTVVFESGAGGPLDAWVRVQRRVSKFATTIAYDRAGQGLSPAGPTPRDGKQIASELHTALQNAGAVPPYILVGHSLGGPFVRVYAGMFPNEVAGMVLVDPTQEELIAWAQTREPQSESHRKPRPSDEVDCAPLTFAQARQSEIPPGIPVVLIAGVGPRTVPKFLAKELKEEVRKDQTIYYPAKLKFYQEWLEKIPGGRLVVTENSGHGIPFEEPELIIETIRQTVALAKNRQSRLVFGRSSVH